MSWCVYDCKADEVIGVWLSLDDANMFYFENEGADDTWGVFPWEEVCVPALG